MRKFLTVILTIILMILLTGFVFTFHLKEVISDNLLTSLVKDKVTTEITNVFDNEVVPIPDETLERIKKTINENEEINTILNKYIDRTVASLSDEKALDDIDIKLDLKQLVTKHKDIIEKAVGITISDKDVDKVISKVDKVIDIDKTYKEIITSEKTSLSDSQLKIINVYNFLTSDTCKMIFIISIVVCILLIAITKKSLYRWLFNLGLSDIFSGIFVFVGSFVLGTLVDYAIIEKLESNVSIELMPFLLASFAIIGVGILLLVVNLILKIVFKVESKNEVS